VVEAAGSIRTRIGGLELLAPTVDSLRSGAKVEEGRELK
jgi:hypothetical protein